MRTFLELAVAAATAVGVVASVRTPRPWLVLAVVVGAALVVTLGSPRWQLLPAAAGLALLVGLTLLRLGGAGGAVAPVLPRLTIGLVVAGVVVSLLLSLALPVPRIDLEDGSTPVGTLAFDLVDPTRSSPSGRAEPGAPRVTPVQVWYPTGEDARGRRAAITADADAFADAVGGFLGLPSFLLGHVDQVRTAATVDAPVETPGRLPVVISLHGWGGFRFAQSPLLEQLAADGHLVLALDHTHGAVVSQPVDGPAVPLDPELLPDGVPQPVYDAAAALLERTFADDALALLAALRDGDTQVPAAVLAAADLDRVVLLGHSTGGGAAAMVCAEDATCRGLVLYDPWVEPVPVDVRDVGFAVPTLAVVSEEWRTFDNQALLDAMAAASTDAAVLSVDGTKHRDVTVESRLSPLSSRLGISGTLGPQRTHEVVLALTRSWLARVLDEDAGAGAGSTLAETTATLPEVRSLP